MEPNRKHSFKDNLAKDERTIHYFLILFFLLVRLSIYSQNPSDFNSYIPKLMPGIGHTFGVMSAQYSPDEQYILTASSDHTAKIWSVETGKLIHDLLGHTGAVRSAQYSPDGQHILTASLDGTAKIWSSESGKLISNLIGHTGGVASAYYSPDRQHILTASYDGTAKIWSVETGKIILDLIGHTGALTSAQYSPDGQHILTASYDNTAKVWSSESGKLIHDLIGHTRSILSARYSPYGQYIATTSYDNTAKVWSAETGKLIHDLIGHTSRVLSAHLSPDGQHILTASRDNTAKVWSTETGKLINELTGHTSGVYSAQYSRDGQHILTTSLDYTTKVWSSESGKLILDLIGHTGIVLSAQNSPSGEHILTTSWDNTAKVWSAETGKLILDLRGYTSMVSSAQYSPDGQHILTTNEESFGAQHLVRPSQDSTAKIWSVKTGKLIQELIGHNSTVLSAQYSAGGQHILTISRDSTAKIWSAETGKLTHDLIGHTGGVRSAQYSPDEQNIVTTSYDHTAKVWSAETGKLIHDLVRHTGCVRSAQYSPDGQHIVTASDDSTANIWSAETGKLIHDLVGHTGGVNSAQYSPDGQHILTASDDQTAKVWSTETGKLVHDLIGYTGYATSAKYSPDGQHILTAGGNPTVKVWSAETGKLIHDLIGHTGYIFSAKYSPDGQHILTTSSDHTAKIWSAETGKLIHDLIGHTGLVASVQYSPDRQYILTASQDGSIILWRASTETKLLNLFPLPDNNWIVLHPSGLFDASPKAMEWMYYLLGQEVIELNQLKERYYEPGLFEKVMAQNGSLRDVEAFTSVKMYPKIESFIQNEELHVQLQERNGGIGKVSFFVNNKEVIPDANANRDTSLSIDLTQFEKYYLLDTVNTISLRAYNSDGWLKSSAISHSYSPKIINKKGEEEGDELMFGFEQDPHLYAVIIGTSDYVGDALDLQFADKDSKDMASAIETSSKLLFGTEKVHMEWFTSIGLPGSKLGSKNNIKAAFDSISMNAKAGDILLVYLSGHGVTYGGTENEQFYYLTKDVYSGDLSDPQIRSNYAISTEEMTQWINSVAAQKQVMILDACSSGKVIEDLLAIRNVPSNQIRALDRMKDRTGMFVLAGSAADKVSYEASQFGQGLLTYSLLLGMSGAALKDGQSVDVMNLFQYARDQVPEFASDIGGVQVPTLAFPTDASSFDIGLVTDEIEIPLQEVKPLFTRSSLEEEESWDDVAEISKTLDTYLVDASSGPLSKGIIFVDVNAYENAYSIKGRYRLEEDVINLQGRLFKGKKKLGDFRVTGGKNQIDKLVENILDEVVEIINE